MGLLLTIAALAGIICVSWTLTAERASRSTEAADSQASCPQMEVLRGRDGRDGRDGGVGLPGPTGPPGEKGGQGEGGTPGEKGDRGITGAQGKLGISSPRGPVGEKGDHGDPGLAGPQGSQGAQGPPTGGIVYVRWGRTVCPTGHETELVYNGTAGGTSSSQKGGAANIICLPHDPDNLQYLSGQQGYSNLYGVGVSGVVGQPLSTSSNYYLTCAVCYVPTRDTILTIPAQVNCPANWTREYYGYLMAGYYGHSGRLMYECIDKEPDKGTGPSHAAWLYHVEPACGYIYGISCPPYDSSKELTCVVCSR